MEIDLKYFILNEDRVYLGQKIGDILNSLQDLEDNNQGLGKRQLIRNVEQTVNYIRRILHTSWPKSEERHLKRLQKIAVFLMKTIEEKGDLNSVVSTAIEEVQEIMKMLGTPNNQLGSPDDAEATSPEDTEQSLGPPQGSSPQPQAPQVPQQMGPGQPPQV